MKKTIVLVFAALSCSILNQVLSLDISSNDLKSLLEKNNAKIKAAQHKIQSVREKEGHLVRSFLPSVHMSAAQETFKTGVDRLRTQPVYGVEGNLNLFNGGKDYLESKVRSASTQLELTLAEQIFSEELQKLRTVYWQTLYFKNKLELLKDAIEINKKNTQGADRRIKSGVATGTDRLEFEMEDVNLKREFTYAEVILKNNLSTLRVIFNFDESTDIALKEEMVHEHEVHASLESVGSEKMEFLHKDLTLISEISTLNSSVEKRSLWPKLDAFASYYQFNQREKDFLSSVDRDEYAFGLRVTIDFPAGFEASKTAAYHLLQAKSAELLANNLKRENISAVTNELNELHFLHDQVHSADENIKRSENYFKSTQSEYIRGVKNSPDVLVASQRLFETKNKRLEIIRDYQIAKGHIMAKMGN